MRISNIASYTGFADKYNNLNNFTSRKNYSFGRDVLSFGKREDAAPADESAADDDKGTKKSKGKKKRHTVRMGLLPLAGTMLMGTGSVQIYIFGVSAVAQYRLNEAFRQNPKNVALQFVDFIAPGGIDDGSLHFEYGGDSSLNPFEIKNLEESFLGADSVVSLDFKDGDFSSASLDIDGDEYPEIVVEVGEDNALKISYDYDSDGKTDTVEMLDMSDK